MAGATHATDPGIVTQPSHSTELEDEALGFESLCLFMPSDYAFQPLGFVSLKASGFIDRLAGLIDAVRRRRKRTIKTHRPKNRLNTDKCTC
jgi:hypothetical protein